MKLHTGGQMNRDDITLQQAAEQALEALEWASDLNSTAQNYRPLQDSIAALRAALAETNSPAEYVFVTNGAEAWRIPRMKNARTSDEAKQQAEPVQEPVQWPMKHDDIMHMTRQAAKEELERVAALAAGAEREACAKVCAKVCEYYLGESPYSWFGITMVESIRARGKK